MERPRPMDRLVCADVGFGKTEIAVRAIFKAVQDSKQAALLVPTTLLASQHFATLSERFAGFPVRVALLSRFVDDAESHATIAGLREGTVDVVVGTHRLLADGVSFKDLGLLVVDEEQRFGVSHKETIKARSVGVDVLTLSASPIPRTLEMAFAGIRDLSMVTTPPADRRPILTHVGEFNEAAVDRGDPARVAARGTGLLRAQPRPRHRSGRATRDPARARRSRRGGARPDGRGHARARDDRLLGAPLRRARVHHDRRIRDRPAVGQHADRRPRRASGPGPDAPAAGPGRARRPARLRLSVPPGRPGAVRDRLRAPAHGRRQHRAGQRVQDRHARPGDPRGRQPAGARPVGPGGGGRLRPLRPAGRRGRGRRQGLRRRPRSPA